jgi:predicted transposase YbfD/YdcC
MYSTSKKASKNFPETASNTFHISSSRNAKICNEVIKQLYVIKNWKFFFLNVTLKETAGIRIMIKLLE